MRRRRCVSLRARVASALACLAAIGSAEASPRDEDLFIRPEDQHVVLFGSLDAGRSTFVSGGSKQTLTGPLDRPGFVALEQSGFGVTRERPLGGDRALRVTRLSTDGSASIGYQAMPRNAYVAAFIGPEVKSEQLMIAGGFDRASKPRLGARAQLELWMNPTPNTMASATLIAGTARGSVWARVASGFRVHGQAYVGPEVTVYTTSSYGELRVGGHVTGLALGPVHLRVSGGIMLDDAHRRASPYAGLSAWMRL